MSNSKGKTESYIRELTKRFVKTEMESEFVFEVEEGFAQNTVHRMRVELARMRNIVKSRKIPLKQFKMLVISVETLPIKEGELVAQERVTLKKTQNARQKIQEILPELMAGDNNG
jgi:hypothetical protein